MARNANRLVQIFAAAALVCFLSCAAAAEEPHTAAEEEYMRKQAAKYYVPDDPIEECIDAETGEIAWKAVPDELREYVMQGGSAPRAEQSAADIAAAEAAEKRRQEMRHNIRSYGSVAAVEWGIAAVSIPAVVVPKVEGTIWGEKASYRVPAKAEYRVLNKGTEIRIALLTNRVDLPEGVIGQLTRPVYDSRGEEIFPQAVQIFGRYNYFYQAIVWDHVILHGETINLANPEEFKSAISLTERTEPGYKILLRIQNTILLTIPIM